MQEIILVGTLHGGLTPKLELQHVLEALRPDQLFVELTPNELKEIDCSKSIRDEMIFAYQWAKKRGILVNGFDRNMGELRPGVTGSEPDFVELNNRMKEAISGYTWQQLNKVEPWESASLVAIEQEMNARFIDKQKSDDREADMLKNIQDQLRPGKIVILTGAGHLSFFENHIPGTRCLLR